jgi:drug/metabolite transporter (DMT)-like permease
MFMGGLLLFAAVIAWGTALMMSPHGDVNGDGAEHVRTGVALFLRNSAIGTLVLCALAGWMLFPQRRPRAPRRDWAIAVVLAVLIASSIYQLVWVRSLLG